MGIRKLGYIGLDVSDLDGWTALLEHTLELGITTDKSGTEEVALVELDEFKYRLALRPAAADAIREVGWIVDSPRELDRVTARLTEAGYPVQEGTADELRLRGATRMRWFSDPAGYRVELAVGEAKVRIAPRRATETAPAATRLGHIVMLGPKLDEVRDLYESVLEFKLTDYRAPGAYFLRCNADHHSIALAHAETNSVHHIELEHGSIDDVGRAHDRAQANGVPIPISLGRHNNDKAISFYLSNPSGFKFEIACGGIKVGDDWTPHDFGASDVWGHHHTEANPYASPSA